MKELGNKMLERGLCLETMSLDKTASHPLGKEEYFSIYLSMFSSGKEIVQCQGLMTHVFKN